MAWRIRRFNGLVRIRDSVSGKNREWDQSRFRSIVLTARYFFILIRQMIRDQCFLRAAALSFTTLLTLIPILILSFVLFNAFGGLLAVRGNVEEFLFRHLLPESVASINQYIQVLISSFNYTTISIVSVAFLLVSAYSLFASIDSSMNAIWGIHRDRSFMTRLINLWFILTFSPIALGYSIYLSTKFLSVDESATSEFIWLIRALVWVFSVVVSWITLSLIYKFVPRTSVRWSAALLGGFCAAVMWEFSKYGFNYYVSSLADFTVLYQSFTFIPIFLLWVELSWTIVLIGAEITYTHHHFYHLQITTAYEHEFRDRFPSRMRQSAFSILESLLPSIRGSGSPMTFNAIAEEARMPSDIVSLYLNVFQNHGLVILDDRNHAYHLVKDPSSVDLVRLMDIVDSGGSVDVNRYPLRIDRIIRKALEESLHNLTLDDYFAGRIQS